MNTCVAARVIMVTMRHALVFLAVTALVSVGSAHPTRDGANHHLGDDSFMARFGRAPTPLDGEALRMHVHLEYVRELLGARPATRPELEARRAELLGYLDDYIAKRITPKNTYTTWRNPVFIDADGNICAVGYLIERSTGRAVAEKIAAEHRLDYLEEIAAAMPEVAAWIASSGLTLDELASIQPGYEGPEVQHVEGWSDKEIVEGTYVKHTDDGITLAGTFAKKQMDGAWKRTNGDGAVLGKGTFHGGAGTWTSFRPDGSKLADGAFAKSRAQGTWRFFYPDGNLAATGAMHHGKRDGTWTFYYDDKKANVVARGRFEKGETVGDWKHYDARGKLVATASGRPWGTLTLNIEPGADGIRHVLDQGIPASSERLDGFYVGKDKFYIENHASLYDEHGYQIENIDGAWHARDCKWSARRKRAARDGDIVRLHKLLMEHDDEKSEQCSATATKFTPAEIARLEKVLASRARIHAPIPKLDFTGVPAIDGHPDDGGDEARAQEQEAVAGVDNPEDMATYLTRNMTWYMEWPHIDQPFVTVYLSMPGYHTAYGHLSSYQPDDNG
jgi:hypothetical protein